MLGSLGLLAVALLFVDLSEVASRLRSLHAGWVAMALAVTVLQTVASAWRWRYTASRLDLPITMGAATREYYLAAFLNQVVPGGVVGDVSRAVRHARDRAHDGAPGRRAVHAVVIERFSGQIVVAAAAVVSAGALLGTAEAAIALLAVAIVSSLVIGPLRRRMANAGDQQPWRRDLAVGLLAPGVFPVQLLSSLAIVASYVVTYLLAARAMAVETSVLILLPLVMPVLLSMLLPVSIAGWGVREAAAGAIWGAAGLETADGVAIALAYGLVVLVGTLPGAVMLARAGLGVRSRRAGPDRTADHVPAAGDAPVDGGPPPASRSAGV